MSEEPEQPRQRTAELHDLTGQVKDGVFVNLKPGVVHQHTGSTIMFHLNSHREKLQIFVQGLDLVER